MTKTPGTQDQDPRSQGTSPTRLGGWMAVVSDEDGPVTTPDQASAIAARADVVIEGEADAWGGCWLVSITPEQHEALQRDRWLSLDAGGDARVDIELP